jgi:hypothetical protein
MGSCTGKTELKSVLNEISPDSTLNQSRIMAVKDSNFLDTLGINIEAGKRQDLFWVAIAVIIAGVLVSISIFGKGRRRKRR